MGSHDSERQAVNGTGSDEAEEPRMEANSVGKRSLWALPAATLVIGLLVTATLALVSQSQYTTNQKRLLKLRVRDAAALIGQSLPIVQTPLASATELANATNGNLAKFRHFVAPLIGTGGGKFASVSLWRLGAIQRGPLAVAGVRPEIPPTTATALFARAAGSAQVSLTGVLGGPAPRLGYAFAGSGSRRYATYAEVLLPASRRSRLQTTSQFAGLDYALYLGRGVAPGNLLLTDLDRPPPSGQSDMETVPFGDSAFSLVMSAKVPLAGTLPQILPWLIGGVGLLLSCAAALGTLRLTERRRNAERLAGRLERTANENRRLYAEQRTIAQTLQHSLLPDALPQVRGVQTSARYEAGERGVDIGGDWYDVIDLGDGQLLLVVGDVSGRGLRAATTMAALRFAIHAYAAQRDPPDAILNKLSYLLSVADSGQLATILCALVDIERREITLTSAGHLPPLLLSNGDSRYLETEVGLPIGVEPGERYHSTTISTPPAATLVAFTDGLVEHRGENLDDGLARLREVAMAQDRSLPELLSKLIDELRAGPTADDIAILGLRWAS